MDQHGHKATMLEAYIRAKALVERTETLPPPPEPFGGPWEALEEDGGIASDE